MYLLDTNIVTHLRNGNPKVIQRFAKEASHCFVSTLTLEEVLVNGCYAQINRLRGSRNTTDMATAHQKFLEAVRFLAAFNLIAYSPAAEAIYATFTSAKQRGMDGRIAAHALSLGYTLVTENEQDFTNVAGLAIENWARLLGFSAKLP